MLTRLRDAYRRWRHRRSWKEWQKGMDEFRSLPEGTPAQKVFKEGCMIVALRLAHEQKEAEKNDESTESSVT